MNKLLEGVRQKPSEMSGRAIPEPSRAGQAGLLPEDPAGQGRVLWIPIAE